jgi:hypothetical protein
MGIDVKEISAEHQQTSIIKKQAGVFRIWIVGAKSGKKRGNHGPLNIHRGGHVRLPPPSVIFLDSLKRDHE